MVSYYKLDKEKITKLLQNRLLTAQDLANMAGITPETLSRATTGGRFVLSGTVRRLAKALGITEFKEILETTLDDIGDVNFVCAIHKDLALSNYKEKMHNKKEAARSIPL